jgi:hypothetical protein
MTDTQFSELMTELRFQRSTFTSMAENLEECLRRLALRSHKKKMVESDKEEEDDEG